MSLFKSIQLLLKSILTTLYRSAPFTGYHISDPALAWYCIPNRLSTGDPEDAFSAILATLLHKMRAPCWTCRSRTIQCDQSRTPCAKCEKAGLECLDKRPLRWVQGVAIRGKMRGRDPGKHHQVTDRQQPAQRKRNALSRTKSLMTNISPQSALQDPYVHHLDWSSRFYLDYCGFS